MHIENVINKILTHMEDGGKETSINSETNLWVETPWWKEVREKCPVWCELSGKNVVPQIITLYKYDEQKIYKHA